MIIKFNNKEVAVRLVPSTYFMNEASVIKNTTGAQEICSSLASNFDREVVGVLNLKNNLELINYSLVSMGDAKSSIFEPCEILKVAILSNATSIIVFHNHPSGDVTPSRADAKATERLKKACDIMGIPLLDHIIVASNNESYSFADNDIL